MLYPIGNGADRTGAVLELQGTNTSFNEEFVQKAIERLKWSSKKPPGTWEVPRAGRSFWPYFVVSTIVQAQQRPISEQYAERVRQNITIAGIADRQHARRVEKAARVVDGEKACRPSWAISLASPERKSIKPLATHK